MNINKLRIMIENEQTLWRNHILLRMRQRGIRIADVINCINTGEIIESYGDDYPFPSALILGKNVNNSFLHLVCAEGQGKVWMITVYYPDTDEWMEDYKTRRK